MSTRKKVNIEQIIEITKKTALDSYGVVALTDEKAVESQSPKTKKGQAEESVIVKRKSDGTFALDVYLVLAQGIKITESLNECRKAIKFQLDKVFPKMCREINIYALDISAK